MIILWIGIDILSGLGLDSRSYGFGHRLATDREGYVIMPMSCQVDVEIRRVPIGKFV